MFRQKVKGGALLIAIITSILTAVLLVMFILIAHYNQRNVNNYLQNQQLLYNLHTAFQVAQSALFTDEINNKWLKNTFNDDSIKIKKTPWGAYTLLQAQTKNRHQVLSQSGIYGTVMDNNTGLLVADNSRPVGMSGLVTFKAPCYLPTAGIKPAYIEGQSYQGGEQNKAFIKPAPAQIPELTNSFVKGIEWQQLLTTANDSVVTALPEYFSQPFSQKTVAWQTKLSVLSHITVKNNVRIIAQELVVDSGCQLDNILIICNKVRFNHGFKGRVHVVAADSIVVGARCDFAFPSSFVLHPQSNNQGQLRQIYFSGSGSFSGGIVAINTNSQSNSGRVFIKLAAGSQINGFVYSSDYLHLEGTLNATVIANKLLLKTPSAVYENHLLACEINPEKYGKSLAVPHALGKNKKWQRCQKLE